MKRIIVWCVGILCVCLCTVANPVLGESRGEHMFTYSQYAPFANRPVDVHYYIPSQGDIKRMPIVFVFEGGDRGYRYLLDAWQEEAEREGFMLFIPHFGLKAYPLADYQEAGVMDATHTVPNAPEKITPVLVDKLFEYIRQCTGSLRKGYSMYGHSAGGQFVQRFMLFHDSPYVEKAIIGSPGWYTFPDSAQAYPYGTAGVPYISQERIKKYLSKPIVLQLALGDTIRESFLRKTPEAERQGRNRVERGRNFWSYIHRLAASRGWECNWRKIEEPGIGHESVPMGKQAVPLLMSSLVLSDSKTPTLGKLPGGGLATVDEITEYLQRLAARFPDLARMRSIGTSKQGRTIPILYLGTPGKRKIKVWMQAALHGNEPAGAEAACMLARYLLCEEEGRDLLNHAAVALVPIANVDGYAVQQRRSADGYDLNRDQTKLKDSVTLLLKRSYLQWNPEVALDIHEYNPLRREFSLLRGGAPVAHASDVLFLPTGHPNVPLALRNLSEALFRREAEAVLDSAGYTSGFYFTPRVTGDSLVLVKGAKSPQSSSTFQALTGAVSFFIEIRGIGLGLDCFARRSECGFLVARQTLATAVRHRALLKRKIEQVRKQTLKAREPIYVTFTSDTVRRVVSFIDYKKNELFKVELPTFDAMRTKPQLVRVRPKAYWLNAGCTEAVCKLRALGIEVEQVDRARKAKVERYKVTRLHRAEAEWEGVRPVQVETEVCEEHVELPAGSWLVPLAQPLGNLVATLLEPESACGFVNFCVIPVETGGKLPVGRLMK